MPSVPSPVLPESQHLRFDCGATVQLGFAAEFSNIMIIYTRVLGTPRDIAKCEAKLTDIPQVGECYQDDAREWVGTIVAASTAGCCLWQELDVDLKYTNKESPEEVGSPLAPTWSLGCPSCCLYSRLCGLQKLRVRAALGDGAQRGHSPRLLPTPLVSLQQELAFTVCLQYRYHGMDDFMEERQKVNVGKPLIAKLNLQLAASPSPPGSPLSTSPLGSWGATSSSWVNTPEENLSPEVPSSYTL